MILHIYFKSSHKDYPWVVFEIYWKNSKDTYPVIDYIDNYALVKDIKIDYPGAIRVKPYQYNPEQE